MTRRADTIGVVPETARNRRRLSRHGLVSALLVLALAGCDDFPKDANGALLRARAGEALRVGWTAAPPWVSAQPGSEPAGIEPELIRAWAKAEDIRVVWIEASESALVALLERNAADIAIGGFATDMPWGGRIGQTQPYFDSTIAIGTTAGTPVPESWDGVAIGYDLERPKLAALIEAIGARPLPVADGRNVPIRAAYASEFEALGLDPAGKVLERERRVIATAPTENALVLALDRFLHARSGLAEAALRRATLR